jgi:hypothetical protein
LNEFSQAAAPELTDEQLKFFETIHMKRFRESLDDDDGWFQQKTVTQKDTFVSDIRGDDGLEGVVSPELLKFCKKQRRQILRR